MSELFADNSDSNDYTYDSMITPNFDLWKRKKPFKKRGVVIEPLEYLPLSKYYRPIIIKPREGRGRPRTRDYVVLYNFVLGAFYSRPFNLSVPAKPEQELRDLLWLMVAYALKSIHRTWKRPIGGGKLHTKREADERLRTHSDAFTSIEIVGEAIKCPICFRLQDGSRLSFTVELARETPRLRLTLPCCGYRFELKLKCPFCSWSVSARNGRFVCNGMKECFNYDLKDVLRIWKEEFTNLGN